MDCSLPGSSVPGIFQARVLELVAIAFSEEGTEFYLRFPGLGQPGQAGDQIIKQELTAQRTGEGNGNPLQYSCLENPMDEGAWWAAVHGVAKSWARLSDFTFTFHFMHWRRKWQPTPVFLPGESQGWGSLVGCRLWGRKELDMTELT